jgi:DNA adenine methylase
LKTPLSYYGGKQQLVKTILGLLPPHRLYCEPFLGGAAIFFAKEPAEIEIINDTNGEIINFYEVLQRDFAALEREVSISLHSLKQHNHAWVICQNPELFDRVKRAWAVWMLANSSYGCMLDGGFGYDRSTGGTTKKLINKRLGFSVDYAIRFQNTQIECCDALKVIRSRDTPDTLFYCDPPYVGSDQGHYDGYSQEDFDNLLKLIEGLKGKFLLSSFRNKALVYQTERLATLEFRMTCSMTHGYKTQHAKMEVLTANYPIKAPAKVPKPPEE